MNYQKKFKELQIDRQKSVLSMTNDDPTKVGSC